jgi:hypothetical protein
MAYYFYKEGGVEHGPFSLNELGSKPLHKDTPVRNEGKADWVPASSIPQLEHLFPVEEAHPIKVQPKPGAHTSKISKGSLWIIILLAVGLAASVIANIISWKREHHQREVIEELEKKNRLQMVVGQMERDMVLDSIQKEKKVKNTKYRETRNNWRKYIKAGTNDYGTGMFGGIRDLDIIVSNNTDVLINEVKVQVIFVRENGDIWDKGVATVNNLSPHSRKTVAVPDSKRGTSVRTAILSVKSRGMNLCYPNGGGSKDDPYFCK